MMVMIKVIIVSIAVAVLFLPPARVYGGPLRGPIQGKQVPMRGPVQGRQAPMRGPVEGRNTEMRQPVFAGNTVGQRYTAQSRDSYAKTTGAPLSRYNGKTFNNYQKTGNWNVNTRWRLYRYDDTVNTNRYRINR